MTATTFNVGRDVSVVCISSTGTRLDLGGMIDFSVKSKYNHVPHERINSVPVMRALLAGHDFTMQIERENPNNDVLFTQIEQSYWAGGYPNGTVSGGTIYVYVTEIDGTQSTYEGTNVCLWMEDRLNSSAKAAIKQTISGFCSTFQKVS